MRKVASLKANIKLNTTIMNCDVPFLWLISMFVDTRAGLGNVYLSIIEVKYF